MGRLTYKKKGKVGIVGLTEYNQSEKLRECVDKLRDYESSGITPEFLGTIPAILEDIEEYLQKPFRERDYEAVKKSVAYLLANIKKDR